jgi:hypothetical protein
MSNPLELFFGDDMALLFVARIDNKTQDFRKPDSAGKRCRPQR